MKKSIKKRYSRGYKLLVGIIFILIMSSLFISCDKNINNLANQPTELSELPQKDEELAKRMALRVFGADMPVLEYASESIAIISAYWGIAVYDVKNDRLSRVVDLISIDMSATQGDNPREILVNKEGTQIIIKRYVKDSKNFVPNYLYDIEKNNLEVTEKEKFDNHLDNMFSTSDEVVKNSLKGINLDTFHYNIAKIAENKWLALKYSDSDGKWYDMRSLKIYLFDEGKEVKKQVFEKYNDLPHWPIESEIIKDHMNFMKAGKIYEQCIGYEGLTEKDVMSEFKKNTDWKFIETDGTVEKYMKKINDYDVFIGVSTSTNNTKNETYLMVRVY